MDEARRFLRYVIPGLVYVVETSLWLAIISPERMYSLLASINAKDNVGVTIGALLASGVLGYIFAAAHHWCHWHLWLDKDLLDHSRMVNRLLEKRELVLVNPEKQVVDRRRALEISWALWHQRIKPEGPIAEAADKKVAQLGDQAHGLGAARIASFFALVTALWFWLAIESGSNCESKDRLAIMVALGAGVTYLFHDGYCRVLKIAQGLFETILEESLAKERSSAN